MSSSSQLEQRPYWPVLNVMTINLFDASQRRLLRSTKENCLMYMEGKHVFNPIDQNIFIGLLSYADKVGSETKETKLNSRNNEIQKEQANEELSSKG